MFCRLPAIVIPGFAPWAMQCRPVRAFRCGGLAKSTATKSKAASKCRKASRQAEEAVCNHRNGKLHAGQVFYNCRKPSDTPRRISTTVERTEGTQGRISTTVESTTGTPDGISSTDESATGTPDGISSTDGGGISSRAASRLLMTLIFNQKTARR